MKKIIFAISVSLICTLFFSSCSNPKRPEHPKQTPEESIQTAFTAAKELDMETFNAYTNNKRDGRYRLFDELIRKKKNETRNQITQALVENLSWEINDVQINGDVAVVKMTIQNKDFSNAVGLYVADLIRQFSIIQPDEIDASSLAKQVVEKTRNISQDLLPYIKSSDKNVTTTLPITLKKTDSIWKIQLDDTLCDILTGNMGSEKISEDVRKQLDAAEELLNRNLERWGCHMEDSTEQWTEQFENVIEQIFR